MRASWLIMRHHMGVTCLLAWFDFKSCLPFFDFKSCLDFLIFLLKISPVRGVKKCKKKVEARFKVKRWGGKKKVFYHVIMLEETDPKQSVEGSGNTYDCTIGAVSPRAIEVTTCVHVVLVKEIHDGCSEPSLS